MYEIIDAQGERTDQNHDFIHGPLCVNASPHL